MDIKRNYSYFWHAWCEQSNGNEYLLYGEDYQGQSVINVTQETIQHYFPKKAYNDYSFCWTDVYSSSWMVVIGLLLIKLFFMILVSLIPTL